jgi:DNA primase
LRLRVVSLPAGEDPADLVKRTGGDEIQRRVAESVAFVRFRVLRALETGNLAEAEGRDRAMTELADVLLPMGPSAEREELRRIAADRLQMSEELLEQRLPRGTGGARLDAGARPPPGSPARNAGAAARAGGPVGTGRGAADAGRGPSEATERSFLALCIALPSLGARALAELDLDADLSSAFTRRAAQHLREHLDAPTAGLADDDSLLAFMRELAVGDARTAGATPAAFEIERLQLTLARLDREIAAARVAATGDISDLARRRWETQARLSSAVERAMEEGGQGARM